ncbi:MAG: peptidylprolyl isomerase [Nitriliruptoraceae bacterium]
MRTLASRMTIFVAVLAVAVAGCSSQSAATGAAATVNGVEIPRSQLDAAVRELVETENGPLEEIDAEVRASVVAPIQQQILSLLIQAQIIAEVADANSIDVDSDALNTEFDEQVEALGGEDEFAAALRSSGLTLGLFRDVLLPAQEQLEGLRAQLLADAAPLEQRTARHILVETQSEADDLFEQLTDGADFADLAAENSIDPGSGAQGGDLGPAARGAYVPPFDDAVWASSIGDIVGPVESDFGFHIIQVTDEQTTPAVELTGQQADQAVGAELSEWLSSAYADADVTIGDGLGEWDPERGGVVGADSVG